MRQPSVSIILAVHNGATTINQALQSIAAQTYQDFEVIIIDDDSTDATSRLLTVWQKKMEPMPVHIIHNSKNQGQTAALNQGLASATGEYIARLDADDWWTPDKLARQVAWLAGHPNYGILGSAYRNHQGQTQKIRRPPKTDTQIRRHIYWRNPFGHSCVLLRRAVVQSVGGYDPSIRYGQDLDLWFRLLPRTKLANLPHVLCHRTVTPNETKQRHQMRQTIITLRRYLAAYHPPAAAWGGLLEPLFLLHARWLLPTILLTGFALLQGSHIDYGTTINDLPYIKESVVAEDSLAENQQELQRATIVSPEKKNNEDETTDRGLLRFKLYSIDADEMVNVMALARINPGQRAFDPHFYMYGGAYLYPLGALYAALIKLGVLDQPTLQNLLTNPDLVDQVYIIGRLFVLGNVLASGLVLYRTARLFLAALPATLALLIYLAAPLTLTQSITMKPHWYGLLPATIALYFISKLFVAKQWSWRSDLALGLAVGWAVGSATTYAPFAALLWLALVYARVQKLVPTRPLITIPLIALATFAITNPFIFLNYPAWQRETAELAGWYQAQFNPKYLWLFIRNSLVPGLGIAGLVAAGVAVYDSIYQKSQPLRLIALALISCLALAASVTSPVSFWHSNARFIPYVLPIGALYLTARLSRRMLLILSLLMVLQAIPHIVAIADENSRRYSTRLRAATWINEHIPSNETICARLAPYDTAPFDFTRYAIADDCRYIVRVEREQPVPIITSTKLLGRFRPRGTIPLIPLATNHINPQISVYENLAAH